MLAPLPFSLVPGRSCPSSMHPCSRCVHGKAIDKKPANKRWKEKMQNAYKGDIKQISMIDMASKETKNQVNKQKGKQAKKKTKGGVHKGKM